MSKNTNRYSLVHFLRVNIQVLVVTISIVLFSAYAAQSPSQEMVFILCAILLTWVLFFLHICRNNKRKHYKDLTKALSVSLENHSSMAFLTNASGVVLSANKNAVIDLDVRLNHNIAYAFEAHIADAQKRCDDFISKLDVFPSLNEYVDTDQDQYRFDLYKNGDQHIIWLVQPHWNQSAHSGYGHRLLELPVLTLSNDNTLTNDNKIIFCNESCRKYLGYRPKYKEEVFGSQRISSGDIKYIKVQNGYQEFALIKINSLKTSYDIILVPVSDTVNDRLIFSGDWDAIEDLPVPLLKVSSDCKILASNKEGRSLLGVECTKDLKMSDTLDGLGRPLDFWVADAVKGNGERGSQFLRGRGKQQDTFMQVTLNPSGPDDDRYVIAVLNDVTELKSLEAQFNQSQKMQAVGQLAGGIAHDFNNLLTAISGHCDLLLLRHSRGDQDYGDLQQISQNANRAASLVGQLLAFSRKQTLQTEVVDFGDSLSEMTHLLNRLVGEKVSLRFIYSPELSTIRADKRQLEQVLMNLVVNARDAMPEGGNIEIRTENVTFDTSIERQKAHLPAGDYVSVKVIDDGHGIPKDKQSKIFEPFYTTKAQGEGTGLGLSTAYGIVKQTGGYIFADSTVGKGTVFELLFPSFGYSEPIKHEKIEEDKSTYETMNGDGVVLLVEDEAPVRAFASRALNLKGYKVLEAESGEHALEILEDKDLHVDLFVTDVIMPGIDGPTWVNEALKTRPQTKVIFVSGYAEDAFGDSRNHLEDAIFLAKPFSLKELSETVHKQLTV